jgi:hypothetical protein
MILAIKISSDLILLKSKNYVKKNLTFELDFFSFFYENIDMEGLTIKEMAEILGIAPPAVKQRLFVAGIKPITKDAVYDKSALEAIRKAPGKGRPRKTPPPAGEKDET